MSVDSYTIQDTVKEIVIGWLWLALMVVLPDRDRRDGGNDLASEDARRFTQIESMPLARHSFKSSKPLLDIL